MSVAEPRSSSSWLSVSSFQLVLPQEVLVERFLGWVEVVHNEQRLPSPS